MKNNPYSKHGGIDVTTIHNGYVVYVTEIPPLSDVTFWLKCELFQKTLKKGR